MRGEGRTTSEIPAGKPTQHIFCGESGLPTRLLTYVVARLCSLVGKPLSQQVWKVPLLSSHHHPNHSSTTTIRQHLSVRTEAEGSGVNALARAVFPVSPQRAWSGVLRCRKRGCLFNRSSRCAYQILLPHALSSPTHHDAMLGMRDNELPRDY